MIQLTQAYDLSPVGSRTLKIGWAAGLGALGLFTAIALADRVECKQNAFCEGTNRADVIIGTNGPEGIDAGRGDDIIRARGGDDNAIRAEGGDDKIKGGAGQDNLGGGRGQDILKGGSGFDFYFFNENNWGQEVIDDQPIVDASLDSGHQARFDGVTMDLEIDMTSTKGHEVTVSGGTATLDWESDLIDSIIDGDGDDSITGRAVADNIQPFNEGNDVVLAGDGNDFVYTADGFPTDSISCGDGDDSARVDPGDSVDADCEDVDVLR